ncbi:MAG: GNAT family N-acetyltransferase [Thermoleophilaceae bacterium]|nr:GNAT family N-acetyltransferase [Thermoleophilaceae bacterium]
MQVPVELRPIRPEDKDSLSEALTKLSDDTVQRRFMTAKPRFTRGELRYLTEVDGHAHAALVASPLDHPDWIIGVARYVCDAADPTSAEVAVVIGDAYQQQGLGTALGLALTDVARENGICRFTATMLGDNEAAHRLMRRISHHLVSARPAGGVREVVAELAA